MSPMIINTNDGQNTYDYHETLYEQFYQPLMESEVKQF